MYKLPTFYHRGPLPLVPASVHSLRWRKRVAGEGMRVRTDDLEGLFGLTRNGCF